MNRKANEMNENETQDQANNKEINDNELSNNKNIDKHLKYELNNHHNKNPPPKNLITHGRASYHILCG